MRNRWAAFSICVMLAMVLASGQVSFVLAEESGSNEKAIGESAAANEVQDDDAPAILLKVKGAKASSISMKWSKSNGAKKYHLFRSKGDKKHFKKHRTFSANKRTFTDKSLSLKKNYYYIVKADLKTGNAAAYDTDNDSAVRSGSADQMAVSNMIVKAKVRGNYNRGTVYGPYLSDKKLRVLRDKVASIIGKYQASELSAYDKICFAHDYIVWHTSYSTGGAEVSSALGPLKYGRAHCQGYSRAFVCLCDALGVKSRYVHASSAARNPAHQWNMVKYKKKWYLMDVQCNDSSGSDVVYLMGKDKLKGFFKSAYRYNKGGLPALAKKSCPPRTYYFKLK